MLKLKNVKKYFDRSLILDIPSLSLNNDLYWVQGENGSGKSTFLRMTAGVIPFEGQITFNNVDLDKQPVAYRKMISWADAEPVFPAFMTGYDIIDFYRKLRGATAHQCKRLTEMLCLQHYAGFRTGTYSSGTLKKLSLVLAFTGSPSLLLLDEPLITLDAESVDAVCNLVREYRSNGCCVLVSSHLEADDL